jgi:hypothetical protein
MRFYLTSNPAKGNIPADQRLELTRRNGDTTAGLNPDGEQE